jgi:hypothetical protein
MTQTKAINSSGNRLNRPPQERARQFFNGLAGRYRLGLEQMLDSTGLHWDPMKFWRRRRGETPWTNALTTALLPLAACCTGRSATHIESFLNEPLAQDFLLVELACCEFSAPTAANMGALARRTGAALGASRRAFSFRLAPHRLHHQRRRRFNNHRRPRRCKPDFEYHPNSGNLKFRTDGANFTTTGGSASFVSSLTISSANGILLGGGASPAFAGGTGATLTSTLLSSALTNSPGFSDNFDIGIVLAPGLSAATLTADLTVKYQSLNGGSLKTADITFVPEPTGLALTAFGLVRLPGRRRKRRAVQLRAAP